MKRQITIPLFISHQGCPHRCIFCDQHLISGRTEPPRLDLIEATVSEYTRTARSPSRVEIAFFGGTFTGLPLAAQRKWLEEALRLKQSGAVTGIRLSTRPDFIDRDIAAFLKDYGVDTVELGVQSFDEQVLTIARRGHSAADVENAVRILKDTDIHFAIQLMPGLPADTFEKSMNSLERALALSPAALRLYPACAFRNTKMGDMVLDGSYTPLSLDEAVDWCAAMSLRSAEAGVPIIRTGLHTLDARGLENLIAGPYHPAFGNMVHSRLRRYEIESLVDSEFADTRNTALTVEVPRSPEEYRGFKRSNIDFFRNTRAVELTIRHNPGRNSLTVYRSAEK